MPAAPRAAFLAAALAVGCALGACAPGTGGGQTTAAPAASQPAPGPGAAREPAAVRVVAFGDSLTAGLGLAPEETYPSLLEARLRQAGLPVEVVNAGVSGDTSAGGVRRIDWSLEPSVRVIILALGGNDALRGLPPASLRRNLATIIERAQARRVDVILAGMAAPPNLGRTYTSEFRQVYGDLASAYRVALVPFLLDGIAGVSGLNQADGIHPNAEGARRLAATLWPLVEPAVRRAVAR